MHTLDFHGPFQPGTVMILLFFSRSPCVLFNLICTNSSSSFDIFIYILLCFLLYFFFVLLLLLFCLFGNTHRVRIEEVKKKRTHTIYFPSFFFLVPSLFCTFNLFHVEYESFVVLCVFFCIRASFI